MSATVLSGLATTLSTGAPPTRSFSMEEEAQQLLEAQRLCSEISKFKRDIDTKSQSFGYVAASNPNLVDWTKQFLLHQESFRRQGKPVMVEIGYHYTSERAMKSIVNSSLRTSKGKREFYGQGTYVANNPHAFQEYGEVGLIVLIVKGVQKWCLFTNEASCENSVDTFCGNKLYESMDRSNFTRSPYFDETVLRNNHQVLPLLQYDCELINNADLLWQVHVRLQSYIDKWFPCGWPNMIPKRIFPSYDDLQYEYRLKLVNLSHGARPRSSSLLNPYPFGFGKPIWKPKKRTWSLGSESCVPWLLKHLQGSYCSSMLSCPGMKEECPICFDTLDKSVVMINQCKHLFHKECLNQSVARCNKCPMCRCSLGEPIGASPDGFLKITAADEIHCGGFDHAPAIILKYKIKDGYQTEEHENPGQKFEGASRTAYLPDTKEGQDLLKRIRYSFRRGLTFRVGTSLTSGNSNVICWASLHHKTVLRGGPHGWPDPGYFENCNQELDQLNVPKASVL